MLRILFFLLLLPFSGCSQSACYIGTKNNLTVYNPNPTSYNANGTGSNITWSADVPSVLSSNVYSASFNGTSTVISFTPTFGYGSGTLNYSNEWNASIWFKPTSTTLSTGEILMSNSGNLNDYLRILDATHIRIQTVNAGFKDFVVPTMSAGTWYNLTITRIADVAFASPGKWHVYLGGIESSSGGLSDSGIMPGWNQIGKYYNGSFGFYFSGKVAEVRIWYRNPILTTASISLINSNGPNIQGELNTLPTTYFKVNEGSGSTINNYAYLPQIGYTSGKTTYNAFHSNIRNTQKQVLWCPSNASLSIGSSPFTIVTWVLPYTYGINNSQVILSKDDDLTQLGSEYLLGRYGGYSPVGIGFQVQLTTSGVPVIYAVAPDSEVPVGSWHFIVAWFDPSAMTVNIKVNNGTTHSTSTAPYNYVNVTSTPFSIGDVYDTTNPLNSISQWDGKINTTMIFKRILTSGEITTLYNLGRGYSWATLPSSFDKTGLISSWDLKETSGDRWDNYSH